MRRRTIVSHSLVLVGMLSAARAVSAQPATEGSAGAPTAPPSSPVVSPSAGTEPRAPASSGEPPGGAASTPIEPPAPQTVAPTAGDATTEGAKPEQKPRTESGREPYGRFEFGSYGRVVVATDGLGGPGREADIVAYGSRMDEDNYAEIELRREDLWAATDVETSIVMTLATQAPIFHYNAKFEAQFAVRNLYLEARDVATKGLATWAGSRMVRGDDLYLLNLWPLDNLNLLGAGVNYRHQAGTGAALSVGATQPDTPFFRQSVVRPLPFGQLGSAEIPLLDRQKMIGALKISHNERLGERPDSGPGIKAILYGEGHAMAEGRREPKPGAEDEVLPSDGGFVVGGQFTAYTGERDTFVHVFGRYAQGMAAYGQFGTPAQLALDETTTGARELMFAAGGNVEVDWFGMMLGAYVRSFRDASEGLNFEDVDEGAVIARPSVFFSELFGLSLEGAFELAQRGVIAPPVDDPSGLPEGPQTGSLYRFGVMPFVSPAGRGNFKRPQIRFIYNVSIRDDVARAFYPVDHPLFLRGVEHFVGLGAEWWFNSTSYGF